MLNLSLGTFQILQKPFQYFQIQSYQLVQPAFAQKLIRQIHQNYQKKQIQGFHYAGISVIANY